MQFRQALIAAVGEQFEAFVQLKFALLVKSDIVCRAATVRRADDLSSRAIDDDLRL